MGRRNFINKWKENDDVLLNGRIKHKQWKDPCVDNRKDSFNPRYEQNLRLYGIRNLYITDDTLPNESKGVLKEAKLSNRIKGHFQQLNELPDNYSRLIENDSRYSEIVHDGLTGYKGLEGNLNTQESDYIDFILGCDY